MPATQSDALLPQPDESVADIFLRIFGPENGIDLDLPPQFDDLQRPPPDFEPDPF